MPTSFVNVAQPFNLANETAQANALVSQGALAATQKDKAQYDLQLQQKLNNAWANAVTTDPTDGHTYVDYNKFAQHASSMGVGPDAQNAYLTFKQNKNIATQGEIMNASTLGALKGDVSKLNETGSSAAPATTTVSNPIASAAQQASATTATTAPTTTATTATATTPAVTATKSDYDADYAKAIENKKATDQNYQTTADDSWMNNIPETTYKDALAAEYQKEFEAETNPVAKAAMQHAYAVGRWTPTNVDFNKQWQDKQETSERAESGTSGQSSSDMNLGQIAIIGSVQKADIPVEYGDAGTPPANPIATAARQASLARSSSAAPTAPTVTATIPSALDLVDRAVSTGIYDPTKLMASMGVTTGTGKTEEPDKSLFEWKPIDDNSNIYRNYASALKAKLNAEGYADASSYLRAIYDAELLKNAAPGINPMVLFADPTHPGVGYSKYGEQLIAQAQGNAQAKGKAQEAVIAAKAKMEEDANKYGVTIEAQNKLDVDDNRMLRDSSLRKDYVIYKQNIQGIDDTKKQLASAQNLSDLQMLAPSVAKAAGMAFGSQPTQFNIEETYKKAFGADLDKEQLGKLVISTVAAIKTGNWDGVSNLLSNIDNYDPAIIKKHLGAILDEAKAQSNIGIKNVTVSKDATTAPPPPPSDNSGATTVQNKTWNQLAAERFADSSTQSGLKQFKLGGQTIEPDPTSLDSNGAVTKGYVVDPSTGLRTGDTVRLTESMTGANAATATQYGVSQGANVPSAKGTGQIYLMTEPEPTNPIARAARQAAKSRSLAPLASSSITSTSQLKEGQSAVIGGVLYRRFNGRIQRKEQ